MSKDKLPPEMKIKLLIEHRPWETESDEVKWVHERSGYKCMVRRHPEFLHLCGYVGVPYGHIWYAETYSDDRNGPPQPQVHGGLTFTGRMAETKGRAVWWLGFDCAHAGDLSPGVVMQLLKHGDNPHTPRLFEEYRTIEFATAECNKLADQLRTMHEDWTCLNVLQTAKDAMRMGVPMSTMFKRKANNVRRKR